jgi:hypothetical protein
MAKVFSHITDELQAFIAAQSMFFVATAPLAATGHVNLSPKGLDSFRVLSPTQVAYLDLTGSGNETSAHLLENGRITFMFCAFQEPPCILRLYGRGHVVLPDSPDWNHLVNQLPAIAGRRQIITAEIHRVQTSCGYGVPTYELVGQRQRLLDWAKRKGTQGLHQYQQQKNRASIDGLLAPLASDCSQEFD